MSLLIVLAFIVIISVLVVGFSESMRLLRPAAASHLERARADQYAWSGVERVIATLNQHTADTNKNWISQPGQLITGNLGAVLTNVVPLHSGAAVASADPVLASPNLNVVTYRDPTSHLLTEKLDASGTNAIPMQVAWIYVRQDGSLDTSQPVNTTNTANPIVGRYAYWADDESSKINDNIAWGRSGNTNAPGHPTRIELSALTNFSQTYADTLHDFVTRTNSTNTPYNFFNTPLDARRIGGSNVAAALKDNKFDVTHFNSDPNTTFFNEPRIVLTTRPDRAGWTYTNGIWVGANGLSGASGLPHYIRILANEPTTNNPTAIYTNGFFDPGTGTISPAAISETLQTLVTYLKRNDWPMVDYSGAMPANGGSLQNKYYNRYNANMRDSRLLEIGVNIIEYVRAKESPQQIVQPIRGGWDPVSQTYNLANNTNNQYIGISRTPFVTEVGLWFGKATTNYPSWETNASNLEMTPVNAGDWMWKLVIEVFLPKDFGLPSVDLAATPSYVYTSLPAAVNTNVSTNDPYVRTQNTLKSGVNWKVNTSYMTVYSTNGSPRIDSVIRPGEYAVLMLPALYQRKTFADLPANPTNSPAGKMTPISPRNTRVSFGAAAGSSLWNVCPNSISSTIAIPFDPTGSTTENSVKTLEVDDPRVNMAVLDWHTNGLGNTLGGINSCSTLNKPASSPGANEAQQDSDSSGYITDASLYMPPPAGGAFTNSYGVRIGNSSGMVTSAGELGFVHTGVEPGSTVTDSNNVTSFVNTGGIPWRTMRLQPNTATVKVVPDWAFMDIFTAPVAAPNQYNKYVYAPHTNSFGGRVNLNSAPQPFSLPRTAPLAAVLQNNTYDSSMSNTLGAASARTIAGNIFNQTLAAGGKQYGYAAGYDSPGEVVEIKGIADGGEKSEELVRQIMNLVTARGNVFGVYTIGQAIKQTPSGTLNVTAQQRVQAMVERYSDNTGVHFAPVYFRNLSP